MAYLKAEVGDLQNECDVVLEMMRQMVHENIHAVHDQGEYQRGYSVIVERYDKVKTKLDEVKKNIEYRNVKRVELERFLRILSERDTLVTEFDEGLWNAVINKVVVHSVKEVTFVFRDGSVVEWRIL
jgi:hypothetical protein